LGIVSSMLWIIMIGWLAPSVAAEPAQSALSAPSGYTVFEDAAQIVLTPKGDIQPTALFFQPGARVDARAYATVLAPVAQSGHIVVIPKQPLGIAFLSTTVFESTRTQFPQAKNWVVGGHSLGGTVAAIDAEKFCGTQSEPVVGLLLFASYPATNMSNLSCPVMSISGSRDGLATPDKIHSSAANLPGSTTYIFIEGGVHAFFGDYGTQAGDGTPTISQTQAREQISQASVEFMNSFDK
jgi:pimeloyl-ACP methyl ester carboxylesterase